MISATLMTRVLCCLLSPEEMLVKPSPTLSSPGALMAAVQWAAVTT